MERQEVSPERNVECELCGKIPVWAVVAGVFPVGAPRSCSYVGVTFVGRFSCGSPRVPVVFVGEDPPGLPGGARLWVVCSFGLVWFHTALDPPMS